MKVARLLLEILQYDPDFEDAVEGLKAKGGKYLGAGDNGAAYLLDGYVYKVTTDSIELDNAQKLKGKRTNNFVEIYDVERISDKLGIIKMELVGEFHDEEVPDEFADAAEREAAHFGIDPEELDIRPSNVGVRPRTGSLKLFDI